MSPKSLFRSIGLSAIALLTCLCTCRADVKLPSIFGDHMVLQQEMTVPVWGSAAPGEKVLVTVGGHTGSAVADAAGHWRVDLAPFPNGTAPTSMTVQGKNTVTFQDVLIGDVWLCSGQSNMEVTLEYAHNGKESALQSKDPELRLFQVARSASLQPLPDVTSAFTWKPWTGVAPRESDGEHAGTWIVCEPHAAGRFSAVAYLFGRELRAHLNRPIGLIESAWGGTPAEAWTSLTALQQSPPFPTYLEACQKNLAEFPKLNEDYEKARTTYMSDLRNYETQLQDALAQWQARQKAAKSAQQGTVSQPPERPVLPIHPKAPPLPNGGSFGPANLFNGMIAPLIPYAIKGVIWYQGEANTRTKAMEYRLLFPRLIADWRAKWGEGDFPFLFVQISHFLFAADESSPLVREAQVLALSAPKTGMAVTVDIPCDDPGHPHDKEDPARRLALLARHIAYGENVICSGPLYKSMDIDGNTIHIHFTDTASGLKSGQPPYQPVSTNPKTPVTVPPADKLIGFAIAGENKDFVPADAKIDGNTVVVSSTSVPNPVAVRFAWGDKAECNLYNSEGLPASPFRTDNWNDFKFRDLAPGMIPPSFPASAFSPASNLH